jgi:hypothetical protein
MPFRARVAAIAVSIAVLGAPHVKADGILAQLHAVAQACAPDIQSFCAGVPVGGGKVIRCLGANYISVSPACRNTMASAMGQVCGQDIARLCPGTTLGSGQAESCLQAHAAELKGTCKEAANRLANK